MNFTNFPLTQQYRGPDSYYKLYRRQQQQFICYCQSVHERKNIDEKYCQHKYFVQFFQKHIIHIIPIRYLTNTYKQHYIHMNYICNIFLYTRHFDAGIYVYRYIYRVRVPTEFIVDGDNFYRLIVCIPSDRSITVTAQRQIFKLIWIFAVH